MNVITSLSTSIIDMTAGLYDLLDNEGNDMETEKEDFDRRIDKRLELPLQISLYDQSGKTINISATGVYFEVITDDIEAFSPGTTIPIQITADTSTPGSGERKIILNGNGTIIRNNIKNVTSHGNELGVAVQFNEHLNISDFFTS
jgi:hypothetical protein